MAFIGARPDGYGGGASAPAAPTAPAASPGPYGPLSGLLPGIVKGIDNINQVLPGSLSNTYLDPGFARNNNINLTPQGTISQVQPPRDAAPPPPSVAPPQAQPFSIDNFPGVSNALALENEGLGQLDAGLKAARERAIINYGDPALASMAGFGLDPQAGAFATQNYLSGNSTLSRLDKAHKQAAQAIINRLASHGLLNSGELGYDQGEENSAYGNSVYDAQQSVLGELADLLNNYGSQRRSLEQSVNDARLAGLNAYLANPDAYASMFGSPSTGQPPNSGGKTPGAGDDGRGNIGATFSPPTRKKTSAVAKVLAGGGGGGRRVNV